MGWRKLDQVLNLEDRRTTERTAPIHDPEQKQLAFSRSNMAQRVQERCYGYKKYPKRLSNTPWFIVSNAALRSRRVKIEMWSESLLVKRSLKARSRAVTVLCRDRCTDWKTYVCHELLFAMYKQLRKDFFLSLQQFFFFFFFFFLMKLIPVINWVCACDRTSVEDDSFLREGWEFLRFGLTEKALFQEILGLLLVYADWEKGGVCLRVCICICICRGAGVGS